MNKLANMLSNYILKDTDLDYEIVRYGIDAILSTVLCFTIAFITCTFMGNSLFAIIFILFLTPIKSQFKSFHCATLVKCVLTYSLCLGLQLKIYTYFEDKGLPANFLLCWLLLSSIYMLCKKEMTKKKVIYLITYALISVFVFFCCSNVFIVLVLAITFEVILIVVFNVLNWFQTTKSNG